MNEELDDGMYSESVEMELEVEEEPLKLTEADILELFQDLKKKAKQDDTFRENGRLVEKLCLGQRTNDLVNSSTYMRQMGDSSSSLILLYNLVYTWASLMTKERPSVYGVPSNDSLEAVSGAEIATKLIEYIEAEEEVQAKWHSSATYAAQHGTSFLKIVFNPTTNRIEWRNLTIFDVWIQNRSTPADVDWCVIRNYIDQYEAWDLLKSVNKDASLPREVKYQDGAGIDREGVEKFEIWYRPSARYPDGLYACVVNDTVVESMKYPYTFPEPDGAGQKSLLPIVWWHARECRESTLGTSWTRECGSIQVDINNLYSKNQENARQAKQWLLLPSTLSDTDLIDDQNGRIYIDLANTEQANMIKWVQPAPIDPNIQKALEDAIGSMYRTSGISESTTGNAYASQSGKALSYQAQLDADKHSWAFKSLERAQRAAWELCLKLCQKHYTVPRTFAIAGQDPVSFMGADLHGVTVKLQARSSREGDQSVKAEKAKMDITGGFAGKEALLTANPSLLTAGMSMFAGQLIDSYLAGEDIELTPETMPPEIFASEIDKRVQSALLRQDYPVAKQLNDLKRQYVLMISGAPEEGQPGAANPAPTKNSPQPLSGSSDLEQRSIAEEPMPR